MAKKTGTKDEVSKKLGAEAPASPFAETIVETEIVKPISAEGEPLVPRTPRVFKVKQNLTPPVVEEPVKKRGRKPKAPVDPFLEVATPEKKEKKTRTVRTKSTKSVEGPTAPIAKRGRKKKDVLSVSEVASPTSPAKKKRAAKIVKPSKDVTAEIVASEPKVEVSPVFKALQDVKLPALRKDDRARLLLQSPTRIYFYWSIRQNPWHQLRNVFGHELGSYTLVVKLADLTTGAETIHAADAEGERWFDVEPDREYQAEIGFYAPNRPYFRIVYSNKIATPRRSPSPHPASDARWTVSANKFAEVLDVSGFTRDAFDVAMIGDDVSAAEQTTHVAFSSLVGGGDFTHLAAEDLRHAMLSIAAGVNVGDLRHRVSGPLLETLQSSVERITPERSRAALKQYFDIDETEWTEEQFGSAVHGDSLVHFPKTMKTRKLGSRYQPLSS